jgi:hypothetical protein
VVQLSQKGVGQASDGAEYGDEGEEYYVEEYDYEDFEWDSCNQIRGLHEWDHVQI